MIFSDILSEFTSLRRRQAELTEDGYLSSAKISSASAAFNPSDLRH